MGGQSGSVNIVFDVCRQASIEDAAERLYRGASTILQYKSIAAGHNTHSWEMFLQQYQDH